MTTIHIAYAVPAQIVERIEAHLEQVAARDPNWNGADFVIERDDYTFIEARDEYAGTQLIHEINAIIAGRDE